MVPDHEPMTPCERVRHDQDRLHALSAAGRGDSLLARAYEQLILEDRRRCQEQLDDPGSDRF